MHDSRTLVFAKDRLAPTFREICGQAFDVSFYERLYAPMDGTGKLFNPLPPPPPPPLPLSPSPSSSSLSSPSSPLKTINEAFHRSC